VNEGLGRPLSSDREKTAEVLEARRLSSVGAHCFGRDVDYVRVATPQCRVFNQGIMPLGDGLVRERQGTDHPTCVAQLKCGPLPPR
jgi:hypothetical protein